jgi:hypothetical protein
MRAVDITPRVEEESRDDAPGDRLYLSNSARHSTSVLGARSHSNFQSVIDSPLLVSRVAPPRTTREKTQTHPPASHAATAFSANAPPRTRTAASSPRGTRARRARTPLARATSSPARWGVRLERQSHAVTSFEAEKRSFIFSGFFTADHRFQNLIALLSTDR